MRTFLTILLAASMVGCGSAAPSPHLSVKPIPPPDTAICPDRFSVAHANDPLSIPICTSRSLTKSDAGVRRAVVVVHGDARNAPDYFRFVVGAGEGAAVEDSVIVAPQFITADEIEDERLSDEVLYWSEEGWKEGNVSRSRPHDRPWKISSYALLDRLLGVLMDRRLFPSLEEVVLVGHSAGGQFVNRYAAGSTVGADGGEVPRVSFVVANPSSYLYFDDKRYDPVSGKFVTPDGGCSGHNRYKYGLDRRNEYMRATSRKALRDRYFSRRVTYLLGALDTDDEAESLDTSCAAKLQGASRLQRGEWYFAHLYAHFGAAVDQGHRLVVVPDVGHDGGRVLRSDESREFLFPSTTVAVAPPSPDGSGED